MRGSGCSAFASRLGRSRRRCGRRRSLVSGFVRTRICAGGGSFLGGRLSLASGLVVMSRHLLARLAQLEVSHLVAMRRLGSGFSRFGLGFLARGWQLGQCGAAQGQYRNQKEDFFHGLLRIQAVVAGFAAGDVGCERCTGILPAWMSLYQSSWCSLAQVSST